MLRHNDIDQRLALRFSHVALPADAIDCEPWEWHESAWKRFFSVRDWQVAAVSVGVAGEQTHHGDVRRWVYVGGEEQFTGADRQPLIQALTDAGKLLDSLGH